jgi:membrane-bound inhibitor of C-type lysozyme
MMKWNEVTRYSQILAIILFIVVFCGGFFIGKYSAKIANEAKLQQEVQTLSSSLQIEKPVSTTNFTCDAGKTIKADFFADRVRVYLSDGRKGTLPQAISASGSRYATANESFVFWNKGNGAFIQEGTTTSYANCHSQ